MALTISTGKQVLTDGSEVFNVYFGDDCKVPLHAYSQDDARTLAEGLASLINNHTCDLVAVRHFEA